MSLNNDEAMRDAPLVANNSTTVPLSAINQSNLSIIDDAEEIFKKDSETLDEETVDLQVYHWDILDFNALDKLEAGKSRNSPKFSAGGHEWSILLFPKGNTQTEYLSAYLALADENKDTYCCAQFMISVSEFDDPTNHIDHCAQHRFTAKDIDWGFTRHVDLKKLGTFLQEKNALRLTAVVRAIKDPTGVLWHNLDDYDSKKVTGYVGLTNQGATCYMNSLFQSLYCTNLFRKAVYQIPTENDDPNESVALALQRVFYNLQFSNDPVATTELTKSFGWDSLDAFMQHDVQEFNRVIQDNLENKMKNTPADGKIKELFVGKMKSYIKCINVNYESARSEDYYDIQLNVKGCKTLEESFKDYIAEETLEGDNKYSAEGHGLQDAKKGVIFESLPPVLHLQLKRYEYDMMRDSMVKINDRHEFPLNIDLEPYLSDSADKSMSHNYALHGVLVHSGDLNGGHYFAFVKPTKENRWLKFDDDRVIPSTLKEVLEENFGSGDISNGQPQRHVKRYTSAYMLVYIRESMLDTVLGDVTENDIPMHLAHRTEQERLEFEKREKEKQENHFYMKVSVVDDSTFEANEGFDFVAVDPSRNQRFRKDLTFGELKKELSKHYNIPLGGFRLWVLVNRQNRTIRLDAPIDEEDKLTLIEIREKYAQAQPPLPLRLYFEKAATADGKFLEFPITGSKQAKQVLIFIKLFDPELQKISGIGKMYVAKMGKVGDIEQEVKKMAGIPPDAPVLIYEEIKPDMMEEKDMSRTFNESEIQDGDILCVQRALSPESAAALEAKGLYTTFPDYMDYQLHKVEVCFSSKSGDPCDKFSLMLDGRIKYDAVAKHVAAKVGVESEKIRFFVFGNNDDAKTIPRVNQRTKEDVYLENMVKLTKDPKEPELFYEVLDVSLEEFESGRPVKISICIPTLKDETVMDIRMPKQSYISDLIATMETKGAKMIPDRVRVFEAIEGRFIREFYPRDKIQTLSEPPAQLYLEEIPAEELTMADQDFFITVIHYQRDLHRKHSVPFKFLVKKDEEFTDTKKRLQERTGLSDKDMSKVKFNIVSDYSAAPIEDDTFKLSDHQFKQSDSLGLDHIDKSGKSSRNSGGRGLIIKR